MTLPQEIRDVIKTLNDAGFEGYAVGGGVRDLLLKKKPKDWDVTTNAKPDEIQELWPKNFYNNDFGTVTVLTDSKDPVLTEIEVTTYRVEGEYNDQRHPDAIKFVTKLTDDLSRRDFTVNALALGLSADTSYAENAVVIDDLRIIDPFGGLKDIDKRVIRAVGDAAERFSEDALRLWRAVRLAAQLDFEIEQETMRDLTAQAPAINAVSHERVRDEFVKLVMSDHPENGLNLLQRTGLLAMTLPEVAEGIGIGQNKHHVYTVFEHNIKSLQWAANYDYKLHIRLAALLHDIGKPKTKRRKGDDFTFYAHDVVGARMAEKLMKRLKFSNEMINSVVHLVRHHMFYYDVGKVTEAGARRLLRRVGANNFDDLIKVRIAERKGSGVPKAEPYRLRHLQFLVEKAAQEPITTSQLAISGGDLMKELAIRPGPQVGGILSALLAEVLDDPTKNNPEWLLDKALALKDMDVKELKKLGEVAKDVAEKKREDDIRRKYHV